MAKFLLTATYSSDGLKGMSAHGASVRVEVVRSLVENTGGRLEAMYFSFGQYDTYVICDLPDHVTAAALAIAVRAEGLVNGSLVPLLTSDQVDAAVQLPVAFQQPGH